jgi:hypothetical protein
MIDTTAIAAISMLTPTAHYSYYCIVPLYTSAVAGGGAIAAALCMFAPDHSSISHNLAFAQESHFTAASTKAIASELTD